MLEFLTQHGQQLLPFVELIADARLAVDEFIDVLGRASLEAVLELSATTVAGPPHQGKQGGEIRPPRTPERGGVPFLTQRVSVEQNAAAARGRPGRGRRCRSRPYEAMQNEAALSQKLSAILMRGVSTRHYADVIPEMAETCGVSKSAVSRDFIEASAEKLKELCERRFDDVDLLIIYLDGIRFAAYHVITAIGVDAEGNKHVLGLREGATENAVVVKALLEDLVERGVTPGRRRPVRHCMAPRRCAKRLTRCLARTTRSSAAANHKVENVMGHLPEHLKEQVKSTMRGRLSPGRGRRDQAA